MQYYGNQFNEKSNIFRMHLRSVYLLVVSTKKDDPFKEMCH